MVADAKSWSKSLTKEQTQLIQTVEKVEKALVTRLVAFSAL